MKSIQLVKIDSLFRIDDLDTKVSNRDVVELVSKLPPISLNQYSGVDN